MEKDIGLSREGLIEMLKKAEEEKAELTAENSSLRNAVVDSKARLLRVRAEPRSAEGGEEEGGEKDIRARAFQQGAQGLRRRGALPPKPSRNTSSPTRR